MAATTGEAAEPQSSRSARPLSGSAKILACTSTTPSRAKAPHTHTDALGLPAERELWYTSCSRRSPCSFHSRGLHAVLSDTHRGSASLRLWSRDWCGTLDRNIDERVCAVETRPD